MRFMDNHKDSQLSPPQSIHSLSTRLRQELRSLHDMVETNPRLALLMSPKLSIEDYVAILARLYGFYRPLEECLSGSLKQLPSVLRSEPRWPRIEADLAWWGVPSAELSVASAASLPRLENADAATGVAYVLEGASLGGRIIAAHLQTALGLSASNGMSFYAESSRKASHWQHVREALDRIPDASHELVLAGAARTYQSLHEWM